MREVLDTPMLMMSHSKPIKSFGESEEKKFPPMVLPDIEKQTRTQVGQAACAAQTASQDPSPRGPAATKPAEVALTSNATKEADEVPTLRVATDAAADAAVDATEVAKLVPMTSMSVCAAQLDEEEVFPSLAIDALGRGPTLLLRRQGMHKAAAGEPAGATPAAEGLAPTTADAPPWDSGMAEASAQVTDGFELSGESGLFVPRIEIKGTRVLLAQRLRHGYRLGCPALACCSALLGGESISSPNLRHTKPPTQPTSILTS
jgi:hypothetical protein